MDGNQAKGWSSSDEDENIEDNGYTWPLGSEVHEQMSRPGGQSEARSPVFKSPSKLGTHLLAHCSRDERLSRPCPAWE
ncbi:hypothetical protein TNCV_654001 [Trichonephila clavipes]|nr:hypothetical protein TNCV_654001 [Trichonephila clavipes]